MLHVNKCLSQGRGLAPVLLKRASTVELDWDTRQKSRFDATDSAGRHLGVFLPRGQVLRGGDVLVAEDGSLVRVIAAPQPVLRITHCTEHGTPFDLVRAAYHLGNRHVPIELQPDHLKIEPDHVLADMLRAMHLIVRADTTAFEPEGGAYSAQGHTHGQAHGVQPARAQEGAHDHDHDREQGHDRVHGGEQDRDHGHGPSRDHDDGHEHAHGHGQEHAHDHDHDHVHVHVHVHGDEHGDDHKHPHEDDHIKGQVPSAVAPHPHGHDEQPHGPGRPDGHKH